jgi:hypothetical protein
MNGLWISIARNVRKACAAGAEDFHPHWRTCRPQLFPGPSTAQVDERAGFFALPQQLRPLY